MLKLNRPSILLILGAIFYSFILSSSYSQNEQPRTTLGDHLDKLINISGIPTNRTKLSALAKSKLHTIMLLGSLSSAHKIGDKLEAYQRSGKVEDFDMLVDEINHVLGDSIKSTADATSLWMQVAGSAVAEKGIHLSERLLFEKEATKLRESVLERSWKNLSHTEKLQHMRQRLAKFLGHQLVGFLTFYGWEFAAEMHKEIVTHIRDREQTYGNFIRIIDATRAESITQLLLDRELANNYITAGWAVLLECPKLRKMLTLAYRRWASFDMAGTFAALQLGSVTGGFVGRTSGSLFGRAIGGLGGVLIGSRLGPNGARVGGKVGEAVGSFSGIILAVLAKDHPFIQHQLDDLDDGLLKDQTERLKWDVDYQLRVLAQIRRSYEVDRPSIDSTRLSDVAQARSKYIELQLRRMALAIRHSVPHMLDYAQVTPEEIEQLKKLALKDKGEHFLMEDKIKHLSGIYLLIDAIKMSGHRLNTFLDRPQDVFEKKVKQALPEYNELPQFRSDLTQERALALYESYLNDLLVEYPILRTRIRYKDETLPLWEVVSMPTEEDVLWAKNKLFSKASGHSTPSRESILYFYKTLGVSEDWTYLLDSLFSTSTFSYTSLVEIRPQDLEELAAKQVLLIWAAKGDLGEIITEELKVELLSEAAQRRLTYLQGMDIENYNLQNLFGLKKDHAGSFEEESLIKFIKIRENLFSFLQNNMRAQAYLMNQIEKKLRAKTGITFQEEDLYYTLKEHQEQLLNVNRALAHLLNLEYRPRELIGANLSFLTAKISETEFSEKKFLEEFAEFRRLFEAKLIELKQERRERILFEAKEEMPTYLKENGFTDHEIFRYLLDDRRVVRYIQNHRPDLLDKLERLEGAMGALHPQMLQGLAPKSASPR